MTILSKIEMPDQGRKLREARRNFGLSQGNLASILGITQARISRWEGGKEEIPKRHRDTLFEVFLNKRGQLDPLINRLIKQDPSLAVASGDSERILHESSDVLSAFRLERSDVDGEELAKTFDAEWKSTAKLDLSFCSLEYLRDIGLRNHTIGEPAYRFRIKLFAVELSGHERIILRKNHLMQSVHMKEDLGFYDIIEWVMPEDLE